ICVEAFVTWTHKTSMEVFVKAVTENLLTGDRKVCSTAFLTFVAVDEEGKPTSVPAVYPESDQEKLLHNHAGERAEHRNKRRKQSWEWHKLLVQLIHGMFNYYFKILIRKCMYDLYKERSNSNKKDIYRGLGLTT